jgi:hypothetical protein
MALFLLAMLPVVVSLQGYLHGPGKNYLTNIYAFSVAIVLTLCVVIEKAPMRYWKSVGILLIFLAYISLVGGLQGVLPIRDYYSVFRAWFIFLAIYYFIQCRLQEADKVDFARRIFLYFWFFVTIALFLSDIIGLGFYTYPKNLSGVRFYFPTNELSYFYFSSFAVLYFLADSVLKKSILTVVTAYIFMLLGTKIFIAFFILLFSLEVYFYIRNRYGYTVSSVFMIFLLCLFILLVINFELFAFVLSVILLEFSSGAANIYVKIQSVGVITAMLGERDVLLAVGVSYMHDYFNLANYFFGKSLTLFMSELAAHRGIEGGAAMIENDLLDMFLSYGVLSIVLYFIFLYKLGELRRIFSRGIINVRGKICIVQSAIFLASGALSGHVVFFTLPMMTAAIVFACFNRNNNEYTQL